MRARAATDFTFTLCPGVQVKQEYTCVIWGPHQNNISNFVEPVQNHDARFILMNTHVIVLPSVDAKCGEAYVETRGKLGRSDLYSS